MEEKVKKEFDIKLATKLAGLSSAAYKSSKTFPHSLRALGMNDDKTSDECFLAIKMTLYSAATENITKYIKSTIK